MSTISNDGKTPAEKANDARPPFDGPHRKVKKKTTAEEASPPYVVAVTKRDKVAEGGAGGEQTDEVQHSYNPKELKAKARAFLKSGQITESEKQVLGEILGPENPETSAKSSKA